MPPFAVNSCVKIIQNPVKHQKMHRLGHSHVVNWDMQVSRRKGLQFSTVVACQAPCGQSVPTRPLNCVEDVLTVSATTHRNQQIAWRCEVLQLLHENPFEALVVGPCQNSGCVFGEAHHFEPFGVVVEKVFGIERTLQQIFREVTSS